MFVKGRVYVEALSDFFHFTWKFWLQTWAWVDVSQHTSPVNALIFTMHEWRFIYYCSLGPLLCVAILTFIIYVFIINLIALYGMPFLFCCGSKCQLQVLHVYPGLSQINNCCFIIKAILKLGKFDIDWIFLMFICQSFF